MQYIVYFIQFFLISKTCIYLNPFSFDEKKNIDISNIIVSNIHAILSVYMSLCVLQDTEMWNNHESHVSDLSHTMVNFSCGYFLYELVQEIQTKRYISSILHSILGFISFKMVQHFELGHFYLALFLQWEVSTVFFNVRKICKHLNVVNGFYMLNDLLFVLTYLSNRIIGGLYFLYIYLKDMYELDTSNTSTIKLAPIGLILILSMYALSWYWFLIILQVANRQQTIFSLMYRCLRM